MKRTIHLTSVLCFLYTALSWSLEHKKLDSLLQAYEHLSNSVEKVKTAHALYDYYYNGTPKLALQFTKAGLELAKDIGYGHGIAESYYHIGRDFKNKRILDSAEYYYQKSLAKFIEIDEIPGQGKINHHLGIIASYRGDYEKAHEIIDRNLEFYTKVFPDSNVLMRFYGLQAGVYISQTNYKAGIESSLKSLELADKLNDRVRKAHSLKNLADLYHYTLNDEMAISYQKQALAIYEETNDKIFMANMLNDLGNAHFALERYEEALEY